MRVTRGYRGVVDISDDEAEMLLGDVEIRIGAACKVELEVRVSICSCMMQSSTPHIGRSSEHEKQPHHVRMPCRLLQRCGIYLAASWLFGEDSAGVLFD